MTHYRVAVIGAGISGICMAIYLKKAGIGPFILFEKASDIGGTWRDNVYPGVECDVPSHLYSFSFELKSDWTREYPPGAEIHQYLKDVVEKYKLADNIVFDTAIRQGSYAEGRWNLKAADGKVFTSDAVISGMGGLHTPHIPDFLGLDTFKGPHFHTARWPSDVDLTGKSVAIVGTGATAVQCAPKVAEIAEKLYMFQRTPVWVGPKKNKDISMEEIELLSRDRGALQRKRWELWKGWEANGLEMVTEGSVVNRKSESKARRLIDRSVADPALKTALTPNYNYTCKRPTISDVYYSMFNQPTVELITANIGRIEPHAIVTKDDRHIEVDAIVFATGFRSFDITNEIDIRGLDGAALKDIWAGHITSYRTVMAPKMPNLFFLLGPNSGGLTSTYQMIEAACGYVIRMLRYLEQNKFIEVVPKQEEIDAFKDEILRLFSKTTQNKGCSSWWTDDTGYPHANWPESSISYKQMLLQFEPRHFDFA